MTKTLAKNSRRSLKQTWTRLLSVTLLIALSIFVFVGLFSAGPNMRQSAIDVFREEQLADVQIKSSTGFETQDKKRLQEQSEIATIHFSKQIDANLGKRGIHLISNPETVSRLKVIKGRLPKQKHEIAIGEQLHKKIGDSLTIKSKDLKTEHLKIVGIVRSSEFMSKTSLGQSHVADGTLSYFGVLAKANFKIADNIARLTFQDTRQLNPYEQNYANAVAENKSRLQKVTRQLTQDKQKTASTTLDQGLAKIKSAQRQLDQQEKQVTIAEAQLKSAKQAKLADVPQALASVKDQETALAQQKQELKNTRENLNTKATELRQAKKQISLIAMTVEERARFAHGYSQYSSSATRMDALALVLPLIFFAISLMVSYTTMRRMVSEKRLEMGTLRALGFTKKEVIKEFIVSSTATALLGTITGSLLGIYLLPKLIYDIFANGSYQLGPMVIVYNIPLLVIASILSLLSTLWAAYSAARKELREKPVVLMLPKPPAQTNNIWLEKIPFFWKKLSFSNKVTLRNAFRYKSRLLMTIFGVMGSISLLILGIGIRDSLAELPKRQYETIATYDMIALYNPEAKQVSDYQKLIKTASQSSVDLRYETVSAHSKKLLDPQAIQVFIAQDFKQMITLDAPLSNKGAILSQKLAETFSVKKGDFLTITDNQGRKYRLKVANVTKNYVGHMLYLNPSYYQKVFKKSYQPNAYLLNTKQNPERLARKLNQKEAGMTVILSRVLRQTVSDFLNGLNSIILIMVVISIMLVYIILYTLTSINVAEREKELATIKVLGFYQKETLLYIFKETLLLTGIGIVAGLGFGYFLHDYVMTVIPPEDILAISGITWTNILISVMAVLSFTFLVMLIMNRHIKNINMLEALKSVD